MSIVWPPTLPQDFMEQGLTCSMPDNTICKNMEVGPPKLRRRDTSAPYKVSGAVMLTYEQYSTFETFYNTTLGSGSLAFTWKHPLTLAAASCTFSKVPIPTPSNGLLKLALDLEMQI